MNFRIPAADAGAKLAARILSAGGSFSDDSTTHDGR